MISYQHNDNPTIVGLSTDEKPTALNGTCFIEMDTGKIFFFDKDGNEWIEFSGQ